MTRLTTVLADDARVLLDQLTDEPGRYLTDLIRNQVQTIHNAHSTITAFGWTKGEMHAVCDAINGLWLLSDDVDGPRLAIELHDGARLGGILNHGADPESWPAKVKQVADNDALARALFTFGRAWWLEGDHQGIVQRLLDRLPPDRTP
jgi:hypothetical protein